MLCYWERGPFSVEQRSKARVQELLVSGKGSIRDKLRLLGVYCLAARPSGTEVAELEGLLRESVSTSGEAGAAQEVERGLGAIGYLRQQVQYFRVMSLTVKLRSPCQHF